MSSQTALIAMAEVTYLDVSLPGLSPISPSSVRETYWMTNCTVLCGSMAHKYKPISFSNCTLGNKQTHCLRSLTLCEIQQPIIHFNVVELWQIHQTSEIRLKSKSRKSKSQVKITFYIITIVHEIIFRQLLLTDNLPRQYPRFYMFRIMTLIKNYVHFPCQLFYKIYVSRSVSFQESISFHFCMKIKFWRLQMCLKSV